MEDITLVGKDRNMSGFVEAFTGLKIANEELVKDMDLPIFMGMLENGSPHVIDLADNTSVAIVGASGSGKSFKVMSILGSILYTNPLSDVTIEIIDTKNSRAYLEFAKYENVTHTGLRYENNEPDLNDILKKIARIKEALADRRKLLRELDKENWRELRNSIKGDEESLRAFPWLIVVVEEVSRLMEFVETEYKNNEIYEQLIRDIESITGEGRSLGVFTFVVGQRSIKRMFPKNVINLSSIKIGYTSLVPDMLRLFGDSSELSDMLSNYVPNSLMESLVSDFTIRSEIPPAMKDPLFVASSYNLLDIIREFGDKS